MPFGASISQGSTGYGKDITVWGDYDKTGFEAFLIRLLGDGGDQLGMPLSRGWEGKNKENEYFKQRPLKFQGEFVGFGGDGNGVLPVVAG